MARETHPPPSSGLPGRLPGLGRGRRSIDFSGDPRIGAAEIAPTAPHATAPAAKDKSGPAGFWRDRRVRLALALASLLSVVFHGWVTPWKLLPDATIEGKKIDDELVIPVDLLGEEAPPPEPPAPAPTSTSSEDDPNGLKKKPDAGPPKPKPDASAPDAEATATDAGLVQIDSDGGVVPLADGGAARDAGEDGGPDGGLVASAGDGGAAAGAGPRDPGAMIGMGGMPVAGQVNVTLLVNVSVIRQNPIGARMGPLLYGIRQWNDFMQGSQQLVDPIRDTDWIIIFGPSLIHTQQDAVVVHYSTTDAIVDQAVENISKRYDKGGPFDAGVPGVKAALGYADLGERVFLRGQPHVLMVVPKKNAPDFARRAKNGGFKATVRPGEAVRLVVKDPYRQVSIKGLKFNESLKELRLWVTPRASDGGADLHIEGDCTDETSAAEAADSLNDIIKQQNTLGVRLATRGLLNNAKMTAEGTHVKSELSVSRDQLEAILQGVAAVLGVQVP